MEDGRIVGPVRNLRFTQSYLAALAAVEAVGRDRRLLKGFLGLRSCRRCASEPSRSRERRNTDPPRPVGWRPSWSWPWATGSNCVGRIRAAAGAWQVVRLGADIGLVCDGCGRRVLLARRDVERRLVRLLPGSPQG